MAEKFDKPHIPIQEQIKQLKERDLIIKYDFEAESILENINYYTLINGQKDTIVYRNDNGDEFFYPDIKITNLVVLYRIRLELNSILLKSILLLETSLKSKISYFVAENFGVWTHIPKNEKYDEDYKPSFNKNKDYLNLNNYFGKNKRNVVSKLKKEIYNNCFKQGTSTNHYYRNHNHIPPWVAINDMSLGSAISWFSILGNKNGKNIISEMTTKYECKVESEFTSNYIKGLQYLKLYRNLCAHGGSIIPKKIISLDKSLKKCFSIEDESISSNDLTLFLTIYQSCFYNYFSVTDLCNELMNFYKKYKKTLINGQPIPDHLGVDENVVGYANMLQFKILLPD